MDANVDAIRIPKRCDDPIHVMLWSLDEIVPILIGLTVGVMLGKALICTTVGFLMTNLYRKYQDSHPAGYLPHMLYWLGVFSSKSKTMRNPFIRRYLP